MECFIVEEGVERKAELEDILPLISDMGYQLVILREAYNSINLPCGLAHMADEIKEIVYRNMSSQVRAGIEKDVKTIESSCKKGSHWIQDERAKLISLIGENVNRLYEQFEYQDRLVWKEEKPIENEQKKEPTKKEPTNPIEELTKKIEEACDSGKLYLSTYGMSKDDLQNAFAKFQDKKNELRKIRTLSAYADILPALALLFEAGGIEELEINGEFAGTWPESLEKCQTLIWLSIDVWKGLTEFPLWILNMISLRYLFISSVKTLPDSICNLKNLAVLSFIGSSLEKLPDSIGNLISLRELTLSFNEKLTSLPDSIGNLKNLVSLNLCGTGVEKLPDTLANCTSLECIDVRRTNIGSFPDFASSIKTIKQSIELIPERRSLSYLTFCNCYYTLAETIIRLATKAIREGFLSIEEDIDDFSDSFFRTGIRFVVDGTDEGILRELLTIKIEHEHDFYRKKLMEIAMEGILHIQSGHNISEVGIRLASMVDIKNNPLDAACAKYFSGDQKAFYNIDFKAALLPEEEREEIRFI